MLSKDRATANVGAGNWKGLGMWIWILFRVSGLILAGYLFAHIWVISQGQAGSPATLDDIFELFDKPLFVFLDFLLVAAVVYHAMNGIRVILMDLGVGIRTHKLVFWAVMVPAALAIGVFAYVAAPYIL